MVCYFSGGRLSTGRVRKKNLASVSIIFNLGERKGQSNQNEKETATLSLCLSGPLVCFWSLPNCIFPLQICVFMSRGFQQRKVISVQIGLGLWGIFLNIIANSAARGVLRPTGFPSDLQDK